MEKKKCDCACHDKTLPKSFRKEIHKNKPCGCKKVEIDAKDVEKWLKTHKRKNGIFKIY
jgi:hypothetical protein